MDYIQQALANVQAKYKCSPRSNEPAKAYLARTLAERNATLPKPTPEQQAAHKAQLRINSGIDKSVITDEMRVFINVRGEM